MNYFYLKGKCLSGPEAIRPLLFSITIIPIPIILFLSFYSKFLIKNFTCAPIVISVILFIPIIVLFFFAGLADPGIMKKNNDIFGQHETIIKTIHLGFLVKTRICTTCKIAKPFRSSHCSDCSNCVMNFDHHCPWIGNCVGMRNYLYFYFFILLLNVEVMFIVAFCITHIVYTLQDVQKAYGSNYNQGVSSGLGECIISLLVIIYLCIEMIFITGLLLYHTKLICSNQSTKEELKNLLKTPIGNIYNRGVIGNIKMICCRKLPKLNTIKELGMNIQKEWDTLKCCYDQDLSKKKVVINPYIPSIDKGQNELNGMSSSMRKSLDDRGYNLSYGKYSEGLRKHMSEANIQERICNTSFQMHESVNSNYQSCNNDNDSNNNNSVHKRNIYNKSIDISDDNSNGAFSELRKLPTELSIPKENTCDINPFVNK